MAPKRPSDDVAPKSSKKHKKINEIGPANLPDGTHKRKVQKIKKDLIHKAKLKKQYAKLKSQEEPSARKSVYDREDEKNEDTKDDEPVDPVTEPTLEPHPDRVKMLAIESPEPESKRTTEPRQSRQRPQTFQKESEIGRKKKEEAEARQRAREKAEKERALRLAERERFRKTMAKARGGPNGQRKLGRESTVLLAKAQRIMGKT